MSFIYLSNSNDGPRRIANSSNMHMISELSHQISIEKEKVLSKLKEYNEKHADGVGLGDGVEHVIGSKINDHNIGSDVHNTPNRPVKPLQNTIKFDASSRSKPVHPQTLHSVRAKESIHINSDHTQTFSSSGNTGDSNMVHFNENKYSTVKIFSEEHPILRLSEAEFIKTPVHEMMKWYGRGATGGGTCEIDFGNGLIDKWRNTKDSYCKSKSQSVPTSHRRDNMGSSSIDCYLIKQTRHHGGGDNICTMHNVSVNMGHFGNSEATSYTVTEYVRTKHRVQPYMKFPKGFIEAQDCQFTNRWVDSAMPGWNVDWTINAVKSVSSHDANGQDPLENGDIQCSEWVDHPVLVMQRDTFANFFHDSEDFINTFLSLAVLKLNLADTQIYLTDLYPEGPFWDIWHKVFGRGFEGGSKEDYEKTSGSSIGKPAMSAWDLKNQFGASAANINNNNHRVCYKSLNIGVYGPAAPICVISWDTPCYHTALVRAYSDFVIRGLNLQKYSHYAMNTPPKVIQITYMARRASSVWPEKKFCDSEHSFFKCDLWKDFGVRSLGRMIKNDQEMIATLRSTFDTDPESNPKYLDAIAIRNEKFKRNDIQIKFRDVDYNLLSFEEQIKIDMSTDIMVSICFPCLLSFVSISNVYWYMYLDWSSWCGIDAQYIHA